MVDIIILVLIVLLAGYFWGKHDGYKQGYQQGAAGATLHLRQQSLENGYCVLCDQQQVNPEQQSERCQGAEDAYSI